MNDSRKLKNCIRCAALILTVFVLTLGTAGCAEKGTPGFLSSSATFRLSDGGKNAEEEARKVLDAFENLTSTKVAESDISRVNAAEARETVSVSDPTARLLSLCRGMWEKSGKLFSPALFALSELWGFPDGNYRIPSEEEIAGALAFSDFESVEISGKEIVKSDGRTKLDLGGIAKGFALSLVRDSLKESGVENGTVNLGGSLLLEGDKGGAGFLIGIKDPREIEHAKDFVPGYEYAAMIRVSNCYVSTSGDAERFFEEGGRRYCHILDPRTGGPSESDLASVTVVCPTEGGEENGALSDLWSTALFLMGMEGARAAADALGLNVFLLTKDGKYFSNLDPEFVFAGYTPYEFPGEEPWERTKKGSFSSPERGSILPAGLSQRAESVRR